MDGKNVALGLQGGARIRFNEAKPTAVVKFPCPRCHIEIQFEVMHDDPEREGREWPTLAVNHGDNPMLGRRVRFYEANCLHCLSTWKVEPVIGAAGTDLVLRQSGVVEVAYDLQRLVHEILYALYDSYGGNYTDGVSVLMKYREEGLKMETRREQMEEEKYRR